MTSITSYKYIDNNNDNTILFLHGWGCSIKYMEPISNIKECNSLIIDLPGFGNNKPLKNPYVLDDYIEDILCFLNENKYNVSHIVAHSFGGKLSTILSNKLNIKSMVLLAPSIFHKPRGIKYYIKILFYKIIKNSKKLSFLKSKFGSVDYKNCSNVMKKTMSNIINESVNEYLKTINTPTILIFGKKDKITPKYLGKKIKRKLIDSELITINGNHFAYLYNRNLIISIIESLVSSTC